MSWTNGTFAIKHSDTFTFGNTISGTGAFVQEGPGTTVLTGNNGYTGPDNGGSGDVAGLRIDCGIKRGVGERGRRARRRRRAGVGDGPARGHPFAGRQRGRRAARVRRSRVPECRASLVEVSPTSASSTSATARPRWRDADCQWSGGTSAMTNFLGAYLGRADCRNVRSRRRRQFRQRHAEPRLQGARGLPRRHRRCRQVRRSRRRPQVTAIGIRRAMSRDIQCRSRPTSRN